MNAITNERMPVTAIEPTFEQFFQAEHTRLVRALFLLTGERAEAEDLAQESMARAFERWERVGRMDSPQGYVYRTAMNLNRNRVRRLMVQARRAGHTAVRYDPVELVDEQLDVLRALRALPSGQRQALVLVEWLDMDSEEAGRVLGIAAGSVRARVSRARNAFRLAMGDDHA